MAPALPPSRVSSRPFGLDGSAVWSWRLLIQAAPCGRRVPDGRALPDRPSLPDGRALLIVGNVRWLLTGQFLLDLLDPPEAGVEATGLEELGMRPLLHYTPFVEDDHPVRLLRHAETVGHHQQIGR